MEKVESAHLAEQDETFKNELIELIHFLRTPLASIKIAIGILNDVFPELLRSYSSNNEHDDMVHIKTLGDDKIKKLSFIMSGIVKESDRINDYIQAIKIK